MAKRKVVILGAGFGGLAAARALRRADVEITVIDRRNHHLFQPLLYQVATAELSPANIAVPVRWIFRRQPNVSVLMGEVKGIDVAAREVVLGELRVPYDFLVVATGARHGYFGHDEWEPFAPGLKRLEDATRIRSKFLTAFERAEVETDPKARAALLTFVVVGAGPTGVELAGAMAEVARATLSRDFRSMDPRSARVLLVEAGARILPSFHPKLAARALADLRKLGVEVMTLRTVETADAEGVVVSGHRIPARTIVWAAGVKASPAAEWLHAEADRVGRVKVGPKLQLPGHPEIFVIGDTAAIDAGDGNPLPGVAPVAMQTGRYVALRIRDAMAGRHGDSLPFRYKDKGSLATIGRSSAIADFGWLKLTGFPAWLLWGAVHILYIVGFKNRVLVGIEWVWAYLTFQRGARLITNEEAR